MQSITHAEYLKAKETTEAYEKKAQEQHNIQVEAFRHDLANYFLNNPFYKIFSFELRNNDIIPTNPYLEERYTGEMNEEIEGLCKKHKVKFKMVYWVYHK